MGRNRYIESGKKYEIEVLLENHKEIARLDLLGYQPMLIAQMVGITPQHVSNIRTSAVYLQHMEILRSARDDNAVDMAKQLDAIAPTAIARLREILSVPIYVEDEDEYGKVRIVVDETIKPELKLKAASDLLNRVGLSGVNKVLVGHVSEDTLIKMRTDALKAGIEEGIIVDVEDVKDAPRQESQPDS